jgi:hypothetical protein
MCRVCFPSLFPFSPQQPDILCQHCEIIVFSCVFILSIAHTHREAKVFVWLIVWDDMASSEIGGWKLVVFFWKNQHLFPYYQIQMLLPVWKENYSPPPLPPFNLCENWEKSKSTAILKRRRKKLVKEILIMAAVKTSLCSSYSTMFGLIWMMVFDELGVVVARKRQAHHVRPLR